MLAVNFIKTILSQKSRESISNLVKYNSLFSIIKIVRYSKGPQFPPLNESDIVETFSNGSGPGGQKLNKTHNRCQIKHLPTGKLHEITQSLLIRSRFFCCKLL